VKPRRAKEVPTSVPEKAKQVGDWAGPHKRDWSWAEGSVWTERMLEALVNGVKGGVWFSLMDKVYRPENLLAAFKKVKANKGAAGVDHVTIERFERELPEELRKLHQALRTGSYRPQAVKRTYIDKPGSKEKRPLGIPTVRDRVAQTALRNVIEPILEESFAEHSYGYRPNRTAKMALRRVDSELKAGKRWVVDADLKSYFDTIPHDQLMERVKEHIADGRVLDMIQSYLDQEIKDVNEVWRPEKGTPQGSVISPVLANLYLNPLDHLMENHGFQMVRYADDLVVLCETRQEAEAALARLKQWTEQAGLILHPEKTMVVDMNQAEAGFDFLGYHFQTSKVKYPKINRWPRKKSKKKFRETIKSYTKRCNGHSMERIIENINPTIAGWFEYFKHSHRYTFKEMDQWIRMRLRSILRRRARKEGRGRGEDHNRWPNAYFEKLGLFSMETEVAKLKFQSSRR
jgi:RNA-directed DNA polymerase